LVTTCIAAAAGAVGAFFTSYAIFKSYDITMVLNGILAGLVGITAGADLMSVTDSLIIGLIAGVIIVLGVILLDKLKLDDPVGAIAVHLVCGIWGTLAVGIFGDKAGIEQFLDQLIGVAAVGAFCLITSFIILFTIKKTIGLRVSEKEEIEGLDLHEHGMSAYPDFRMNEH
jgi:Amt family ammonium transporter